MRRVREGWAGCVNPFGGQRYRVSLTRETVACFVFWSKNFAPFTAPLAWLEANGFPFYLHYTITGLPAIFEPGLPDAATRMATLKKLGRRYSARRVLWRYDPIVITSLTGAEWHIRRFQEMAGRLEGFTERCYISFAFRYAKVWKHFKAFETARGVSFHEPAAAARIELAQALAEIAKEHGMTLYACCNDELIGPTVHKAACIDGDLIRDIFYSVDSDQFRFRKKGTRKTCGCAESPDIGAYDTCPHGCIYCYANTNREKAGNNWRRHDSASAFLGYDRYTSGEWALELEADRNRNHPQSEKPVDQQLSLF